MFFGRNHPGTLFFGKKYPERSPSNTVDPNPGTFYFFHIKLSQTKIFGKKKLLFDLVSEFVLVFEDSMDLDFGVRFFNVKSFCCFFTQELT